MSLISSAIFRLKHFYRKTRNGFIVPGYDEKRSIILSHATKYDTHIFIETGTFLGDTLSHLKENFRKLISFELDGDLAKRAMKRFESTENIRIIQGDSGKLLAEQLQFINEPCLFWLDGHFSSEFFVGNEFIKTAKGDKETPVLEELHAIFSHPVKNHVVLIDDARCFNGSNDYPALNELKKIINTLAPGVNTVVKRDIIRITPG